MFDSDTPVDRACLYSWQVPAGVEITLRGGDTFNFFITRSDDPEPELALRPVQRNRSFEEREALDQRVMEILTERDNTSSYVSDIMGLSRENQRVERQDVSKSIRRLCMAGYILRIERTDALPIYRVLKPWEPKAGRGHFK